MSEEEEAEVESEESSKEALINKCLETLRDNSSSFVVMIQAGPEYMGECFWDGNVEACASMVQRVEEEFRISVYGEDTVIVIGGDDEEDEEWMDCDE